MHLKQRESMYTYVQTCFVFLKKEEATNQQKKCIQCHTAMEKMWSVSCKNGLVFTGIVFCAELHA